MVSGATVCFVGFWTDHGGLILQQAEAKVAAVIGPDEGRRGHQRRQGDCRGGSASGVRAGAGRVQAAAPVDDPENPVLDVDPRPVPTAVATPFPDPEPAVGEDEPYLSGLTTV